jgi:2-methylcitrate dehydratase PrpD
MLDGAFLPNIFGFTPKVAALTDGLGGRAALIEVSFKPWCAARQTMAATQATKEVMQAGVAADDMTAITAYVLPPHLRMIDHGVTAGDRASHLTSLAYQMALAACAPEAASDVRQSPGSLPAPVAAFMQKIRVVADEELLTAYPKAWPARVVAETQSGRHERTVSHVPGDPERAFSDADVREKFLRFTAPLLQDDGAEEALRLCLSVFDDSEGPALLLRDMEQVYADSIADAQ